MSRARQGDYYSPRGAYGDGTATGNGDPRGFSVFEGVSAGAFLVPNRGPNTQTLPNWPKAVPSGPSLGYPGGISSGPFPQAPPLPTPQILMRPVYSNQGHYSFPQPTWDEHQPLQIQPPGYGGVGAGYAHIPNQGAFEYMAAVPVPNTAQSNPYWMHPEQSPTRSPMRTPRTMSRPGEFDLLSYPSRISRSQSPSRRAHHDLGTSPTRQSISIPSVGVYANAYPGGYASEPSPMATDYSASRRSSLTPAPVTPHAPSLDIQEVSLQFAHQGGLPFSDPAGKVITPSTPQVGSSRPKVTFSPVLNKGRTVTTQALPTNAASRSDPNRNEVPKLRAIAPQPLTRQRSRSFSGISEHESKTIKVLPKEIVQQDWPYLVEYRGVRGGLRPDKLLLTTREKIKDGGTLKSESTCRICGKYAKGSAALYHASRHFDIRTYNCPQCDYYAAQSADLNTHVKNHHGSTQEERQSPQESFKSKSSGSTRGKGKSK